MPDSKTATIAGNGITGGGAGTGQVAVPVGLVAPGPAVQDPAIGLANLPAGVPAGTQDVNAAAAGATNLLLNALDPDAPSTALINQVDIPAATPVPFQ